MTKAIKSVFALITAVFTGLTATTQNLCSAAEAGSSALTIFAEDAEDAAKATTLENRTERKHNHKMRMAEIAELEATITPVPSRKRKAA